MFSFEQKDVSWLELWDGRCFQLLGMGIVWDFISQIVFFWYFQKGLACSVMSAWFEV